MTEREYEDWYDDIVWRCKGLSTERTKLYKTINLLKNVIEEQKEDFDHIIKSLENKIIKLENKLKDHNRGQK